MTLDELLAWAQEALANRRVHSIEKQAAQAVIDLLGADLPCGYETPVIDASRCGHVSAEAFSGTSDEARAWASAILRAADLADRGAR